MTTDVEKMLRDYYEVWNSHDVERITSFLADEFLYEDVPAGVAHRNKDEFKASWRDFFAACPDFRVEWKTLFVAGDWAAAESVMTATHTGDFPMLPATGKSVSVRAASIIEMQGDKIKRNTNYFNMASLMQQLGVMPEMPSG